MTIELVSYYLAVLLIGSLGFIPVSVLFTRATYLCWPISKVLSPLVLSVSVWWQMAYLHVSLSASLFTSSVAFILFAVYLYRKREAKISFDLPSALKFESLFIVLFAVMLFLRGAIPQIEGIEKFMDFAILNGILRQGMLPLQDVWYSGETINYYYFGHFFNAVLIKFSGVSPSVGYNLCVGYLFATSGMLIYTLTHYISRSILGGIVSVVLLLFAGNLDPLISRLMNPSEFYFYAEARSLLPNAITEFPAYSFLIGDLHAHIMNIPFVLLFLFTVSYVFRESHFNNRALHLLCGVLLGVIAVTNSWDVLVQGPILLMAYALVTRTSIFSIASLRTSSWLLLGILVFLPFFLQFSPNVGGVGFKWAFISPEVPGTMFGLFGVFLLWVMLFHLRSKDSISRNTKLLLSVLVTYIALIIFIPNLLFIKDIYFELNPAYYRANTIFKLWYQAWLLLSVLVGCVVGYVYKQAEGYSRYFFLVGIVVLCGVGESYWLSSVRYIVGAAYTYRGLNGSEFILQSNPTKYQMLQYINRNNLTYGVLLEAYGRPYSRESLFSTFTGLPTPLGWNEHELGWRGNWPAISSRMGDIQTLYTSADTQVVQKLLRKYDISYAVVTDTERTKFGSAAGIALHELSSDYREFGDYTLMSFGRTLP